MMLYNNKNNSRDAHDMGATILQNMDYHDFSFFGSAIISFDLPDYSLLYGDTLLGFFFFILLAQHVLQTNDCCAFIILHALAHPSIPPNQPVFQNNHHIPIGLRGYSTI
ncbi:hypothetical protein AWENTII_009812 [Aspergillus wentii]